MKKVLVATFIVALVMAIFTAGYLTGSNAVIHCPKWVEEDNGMMLVVLDFNGQEYVDLANKPSHMYNFFSYVTGRR